MDDETHLHLYLTANFTGFGANSKLYLIQLPIIGFQLSIIARI